MMIIDYANYDPINMDPHMKLYNVQGFSTIYIDIQNHNTV